MVAKRILIFPLVIGLFTIHSCTIFQLMQISSNTFKTPTQNTKIGDGKVIIIGKIILTPKPIQNIPDDMATVGNYKLKDWCDLGFFKNSNSTINPKNIKSDYYAKAKMNDYFILEIPKKEIWLRVVGFVLRMHARSALSSSGIISIKINPLENDNLIYIGDITIPYIGPDSGISSNKQLTIIDNFDNAMKYYSQNLIDKSGTPLKLIKNIASFSPNYTWNTLEQVDIKAY